MLDITTNGKIRLNMLSFAFCMLNANLGGLVDLQGAEDIGRSHRLTPSKNCKELAAWPTCFVLSGYGPTSATL